MNDPMMNGTTQVIRIPKVGVEGVKVPLSVYGDGLIVGVVDAYVALDPVDRGVHLSRLVGSLSQIDDYQLPAQFGDFLKDTIASINTHDLFIRVTWEDLYQETAPATGSKSFVPISYTYGGLYSAGEIQFFQGIMVPYTSSCPCSKEISDMGAHNQRSRAYVNLLVEEFVDPLLLLAGILDIVPSPIYNVLKRPDEKMVTEAAYQNSQFVEDVARSIGQHLVDNQIGLGWKVKIVHEESIHTHNVVAVLRGGKEFVA